VESWIAAGGAARATAAAYASEYLVLPIGTPDLVTVSAALAVERPTANSFDHHLEVAVPNDVMLDEGIACELYQPPVGLGDRELSLWDDVELVELGSQPLAWIDNTVYTVALTRRGASYTCSATDPAGARVVASGASGSTAGNQPTAVVRAVSVTGRVAWVMVVRSP
jgi:hypothetical protein